MCLTLTGVSNAQQVQTRAAQPQQAQQGQAVQAQGQPKAGQVGQAAQWQNTDQILASCIAIANQKEVTIAKMAGEKAKSKDVKDFANMLVKDHSDFLQKLRKFAPEASQEGFLNDRGESTANSDRRTTANPPRDEKNRIQPAGGEARNANNQVQQTAGVKNASETGQPLDMVQLHREIAEECIRSARQGMDKKEGAEFDECFVGFQIAAHASMKDKLTVFERHASGDLKQVIAQGRETTEKHLKHAEDLMKDLAHSARSDAKRDRTSSK